MSMRKKKVRIVVVRKSLGYEVLITAMLHARASHAQIKIDYRALSIDKQNQ